MVKHKLLWALVVILVVGFLVWREKTKEVPPVPVTDSSIGEKVPASPFSTTRDTIPAAEAEN
jgi:hypothetical protein